VRIKRLVVRGEVRFSEKARLELEADGLEPEDAIESIPAATTVQKILRSRSERRSTSREKVHAIVGPTLAGIEVYTKGVLRKDGGGRLTYILVSSKRSTT